MLRRNLFARAGLCQAGSTLRLTFSSGCSVAFLVAKEPPLPQRRSRLGDSTRGTAACAQSSEGKAPFLPLPPRPDAAPVVSCRKAMTRPRNGVPGSGTLTFVPAPQLGDGVPGLGSERHLPRSWPASL